MPDLSIPYGLDPDNHMVSARNVPRGAACGCRCPACERPLVAHQGATDRAWHFQHMPDAAGATAACATAFETSIHRKAKDIVLANLRIATPVLMARYGNRVRQAIPPGWLSYATIAAEAWLGDIRRRPDVLVETSAGPLAIEIYYTHRCPPEKIAAFAAGAVTAVEIDLSTCNRDIVGDEAALTAMVLRSARRDWLFHPEKAPLDAAFMAEVVEQERVAAEREAARLAAIWQTEQERTEQRNTLLRHLTDQDEIQRKDREARHATAEAERNAHQAEIRREAEATARVHGLARDDAAGTSQRCAICNKPYSPFGFGLPPRVPVWACGEHRSQVDAMKVAWI